MPKAAKAAEAVVKRIWRRKGDDGHTGAWKVAFADFCLALLCLFLVMWLMSARKQEAMQELLKASGGRPFDEGRGHLTESMGGPRGSFIAHELANGEVPLPRMLTEVPDGPISSESRPARPVRLESSADLAELAQILTRLSGETGLAANVQWMITPYGLRVMLHDTDREGMFEVGSAQPTERFRELLQKLGPLFNRIENQMLIVGHTDARQYADHGPEGMSNWRLSSDRAMAARSYLLSGGMPVRSVMQVVGLADGAPLNTTDPSAAENRRIELVILTSAQARSISAMYGAPGTVEPLMDGVDTSLPDRESLAALRGLVSPVKR